MIFPQGLPYVIVCQFFMTPLFIPLNLFFFKFWFIDLNFCSNPFSYQNSSRLFEDFVKNSMARYMFLLTNIIDFSAYKISSRFLRIPVTRENLKELSRNTDYYSSQKSRWLRLLKCYENCTPWRKISSCNIYKNSKYTNQNNNKNNSTNLFD